MRRTAVLLLMMTGFWLTDHPLVHTNSAGPILPQLPTSPTFVVSTVPPNRDLNPYGVAYVPDRFPTGDR